MTILKARWKATKITTEHMGMEDFHASSSYPYSETCFTLHVSWKVCLLSVQWSRIPVATRPLFTQAGPGAAWEREAAAAADWATLQPSHTCSLSCDH